MNPCATEQAMRVLNGGFSRGKLGAKAQDGSNNKTSPFFRLFSMKLMLNHIIVSNARYL